MKTLARRTPIVARLALAIALASLASIARVDAADARTQAAREHAERQAIKNDLKRVQADVGDLIESQNALLRQIAALESIVNNQAADIRRLQGDLAQERARNATRFAGVEDIKTLTDKLQELDIKRKKDADLIVKELSGISKEYQSSLDQFDKRSELLNKRLSAVERAQAIKPGSAPPPIVDRAKPAPEPQADQEGVYHTIAAGEFVGRIIAAYNAAWKQKGGKRLITFDSVKKANPKINLDRVQIGQEIFIPLPAQ